MKFHRLCEVFAGPHGRGEEAWKGERERGGRGKGEEVKGQSKQQAEPATRQTQKTHIHNLNLMYNLPRVLEEAGEMGTLLVLEFAISFSFAIKSVRGVTFGRYLIACQLVRKDCEI